jgi:hypothetical protein
MKQLKKHIICIVVVLLGVHKINAQTDFEKYVQQQREAFNNYSKQKEEKYKRFRDSLNHAFAAYLEQEWRSFNLQKSEPPIKKPVPVPPVYDNTTPPPPPEKIPVTKAPVKVPDKPVPPPPKPVPPTIPEKGIHSVFFGTAIRFKEMALPNMYLSGVAEKDMAQYWRDLSKLPYMEMIGEIDRIKTALRLNDWGVYQLLGKMFHAYFPQSSNNEKVLFSVFMLNQMGYRAKIGRDNNELIPLVAFHQKIYNCPYFIYGGKGETVYSVLNPSRKELSKIQTCIIDYADAFHNMDLSVSASPRLAEQITTKTLHTQSESYRLQCNKNIVDFYKDYPCVDFFVYAQAALDAGLLRSLEEEISPQIAGKSQEEAVNRLLYFVQNAFQYKTDGTQFGYEKWNFAEETIVSSYSDCEDRSILFAQLVHHFLKLPVVLVHYPNIHLATAVKFSNPSTHGDYFVIDGERYLICDPTYINSTLGMSMPNLRNVEAEIIKLK